MWYAVNTHIKLCLIAIVLLLLQTGWLTAQPLSNEGKEFWVAYAPHRLMGSTGDNSQEMVLYFSATANAHVIVTINGTTYKQEYDVPANTVSTGMPIPKGIYSYPAVVYDARLYPAVPSPSGNNVEGKYTRHAVHIESNVPIVAYARISGAGGAATALLLPIDTWGYTYRSLNFKQSYSQSKGGSHDCFSWIYIIAGHDDTHVTVLPAANTRGGHQEGVAFNLTLQKGEVYLLAGEALDEENGEDLSGTVITATAGDAGECYPVAVFSGSSYTQVACVGTDGNGQNLLQQEVPLNAWGRQYLTCPTSVDDLPQQHNINIYRILVADPATIVRKNGQRLLGLNGSYYEYQSNTADFVEADKPILLAQYMPSDNACNYAGQGSPAMIYLSAKEQAVYHTRFYRNDNANVSVRYLSLILPAQGLNSLKIDGALNNYDDVYTHPNNTAYKVVVKRWTNVSTQCTVESDAAFTAISYGMGAGLAYGFNAGMSLSSNSGFAVIQNKYGVASARSEYTCVNTPVALSVLMRYQPERMEWRFSALSSVISPATDTVLQQPVAVGTEQVGGVLYYRYNLPGYYQVRLAGTYDIPLYASSPAVANCSQTEQIPFRIQVKPGQTVAFDIHYAGCLDREDVFFEAAPTMTDGEEVKKWEWYFPEDSIATDRKTIYSYAPGTHDIRLLAADAAGCVVDTAREFVIPAKPVAAFSAASTTVCEGTALQFNDESTSAPDAITEWHWSFGDGAVSLLQYPVKTYTTPGSYQVSLTVENSAGCISTPASGQWKVYPLPRIEAGADIYALENSRVTLNATASNAASQTFSWMPAALLNRPDILNPVYQVVHDQLFVITARGAGNCTATDTVQVKMLLPVEAPNSFSPNGDGIHDQWLIPHLAEYTGATVTVINRYGQRVFQSNGYTTPWDGTVEGKPVMAGTYYYIIRLPGRQESISGTLTILR